MKKHIPNTITSCNLICGCIAIYFAMQSAYDFAFYFIIGGAVFDFFDGFAARLLGVSSPIGKELDSLADDVTFGVAPSAVLFSLLRETLPVALPGSALLPYLPFAAFIMAAFSALRLAKFNLDERQSTSFIGLPTPANTLFGQHWPLAHTIGWWPRRGAVGPCWLAFCSPRGSSSQKFPCSPSSLNTSD